jgi:hypothetical protein
MYTAAKERAIKWLPQLLLGSGSVLVHQGCMLVARAGQGEPLRLSRHRLS